ncbi:MAG: sugar porter family MFS transporter [Bacteroidota bacterium]
MVDHDTQGKSGFALFLALVVSLGGFLFGFDAGIISGVMNFASPYFALTDSQEGSIVAAPTLAAMFAMLAAGRLSDFAGRRPILIIVAFLYALSAIWSAYASSYLTLYLARVIGGIAFGAALVIAPTFIAEIATAKRRGALVSLQQLNIVLGFFAAFLCNAYFNYLNEQAGSSLTDDTVWRWMLGVEFVPAILYFILLFWVPRSPRWLYVHGKEEEAEAVLLRLHGPGLAASEGAQIKQQIENTVQEKTGMMALFNPAIRTILLIGIAIGILQQVTGINAVYFYATSIFKQTGIGTNAAFASGVLLSMTSVLFTIVAIVLIDRVGRRPLLLWGMGGIALSMLLCAYSFNTATYQIKDASIEQWEAFDASPLRPYVGEVFTSDVAFKNTVKEALGEQVYKKHEGEILEQTTTMNAVLVMIGILCFVACFAFSLGPVMWVLLSELYPNQYRGLAIGFIGFINGFASWLVSRIFPLELNALGSALTFLIFGLLAVFGFFLFLKILPETKGASLEEIEQQYAS